MLNFFKQKKQNAICVVSQFLKVLNIKVSNATIKRTLIDHPDYPNLSSISDSLSEWHLPNQAYNISKADFDANDLYYPFIAHSKVNNGRYFLVHQIENQQVMISDEHSHKTIITEQEFLSLWSGIALHATLTKKSGEKNYAVNQATDIYNQIKLPFLICICFGILVLQIDLKILGWDYLSLFIIKPWALQPVFCY